MFCWNRRTGGRYRMCITHSVPPIHHNQRGHAIELMLVERHKRDAAASGLGGNQIVERPDRRPFVEEQVASEATQVPKLRSEKVKRSSRRLSHRANLQMHAG